MRLDVSQKNATPTATDAAEMASQAKMQGTRQLADALTQDIEKQTQDNGYNGGGKN